ncbi:MAG TPA: MFS transporter [Gemmatimonadales bacterium]|nr:MFS transporter [Gemmatimonadales bacterium]
MTAPGTGEGARDQFRRLAVLIAIALVDMIGFAIILPILPFYVLDLEATPFVVGIITAAFSAAQILASPIWGRVSDHYGRRPVLLVGLVASGLAYVVFGLATSIWLLLLSRVIQGAGGGTTGVAQAYIADAVEPASRARALGWLSAATSAGMMLGPMIGSYAAHWGRAAPGFVAAALCLVNAVFAYYWLPESRVKLEGHAPARRPVWHAAWQVVRHPGRPVSQVIWIYGVGMLAFSALTSVLALYLGARFGVTATTIGPYFLYVGGLSVVLRSLLLGPVVDRIGETWAMRLGTLALILGLLLYPTAHSIPALLCIMPLVPVGTALLFPACTSLIAANAEAGETGTVMGVAQTWAGMSRVVAPLLATAAFEVTAWLPFVLGAATVAVVTVLAFRVPVVPPRRRRAQPSA